MNWVQLKRFNELTHYMNISFISMWRKYSSQPYIGYYKLLKPAIVARDSDLIKDIMITKFNCFRNNDFNVSKKHDPLIAQNPFFTRDDEWKEGRKLVTPIYSSSKVSKCFEIRAITWIKSQSLLFDFSWKIWCLLWMVLVLSLLNF